MSFADLVTRADRAAQNHLGGVVVTYEPEFGQAFQVTGMFDENYVLVDPGGDGRIAVEQVGPSVFFRLADLSVNPDDDEPVLTIGGLTYKVTERKRDGLGGIRLMLQRTGE